MNIKKLETIFQMKIYKAAIIGLGASGLAVNKLIYGNSADEIISFEKKI